MVVVVVVGWLGAQHLIWSLMTAGVEREDRKPPSPDGDKKPPSPPPGDMMVGVSLPQREETGVMVPAGLPTDRGVRLPSSKFIVHNINNDYQQRMKMTLTRAVFLQKLFSIIVFCNPDRQPLN